MKQPSASTTAEEPIIQQIALRPGKEQSLLRHHPWVFSGALCLPGGKSQPQEPEHLQPGDLVRVVSAQGQLLGTGHWEPGSIAVRMLTFGRDPIDKHFWLARLREAHTFRARLGLINAETNAFRLVHGEGDGLPGLIIDVYAGVAVMQAHSVGMHRSRQQIADLLPRATDGLVRQVYYKSATTLPRILRERENDNLQGFLLGEDQSSSLPCADRFNPTTSIAPGGEIAKESGLQFHIDWLRGQKTGFFLDQRDNRRLIEEYAKGRNVLNMFCYTGGFSVYALRGGANLVHSVDSSERAIELTRENVELNFPDDHRHEAIVQDAFKFLEQTPPDHYDLIVLDPPAFAKHLSAVRQGMRGYSRLNELALKKIQRGGLLFTFSCSQAVSKEQFRQAVYNAAISVGRPVRILRQLHQGADHPISLFHPEGEYLKGLVLEVE